MSCRKATGTRSSLDGKAWLVNTLLAAGMMGAEVPIVEADSLEDEAAAVALGESGGAGRARFDSLPEVSVTGQRSHGYAPASIDTGPFRGQDALDVPATINVVTRAVMDAQADTGLYDVLRNVAGVTRQQLNGVAYDNLAIRGIPLNNRSNYYINGVLPVVNNIWMPMQDKERVEVLKGASALYYGFASPAGIVNMVTKRAGAEPVTRVSLLGDSRGSYGAHVDIGRRFGEDNQFGLRVNAMDEHVEPPIEGDEGYRKFLSAAFDWRVNTRLTLQYDFEHTVTHIVEQAGIEPLKPKRNGVIVLPGMPDPTRLLSSRTRPTVSSADTHLLRADYALSDNWTATLAAGQSMTRRDRWAWVFQKYNVSTGAGTLQVRQQDSLVSENKNIRLEANGVFKTGPLSHDVTFGGSQNWLLQPDADTYAFSAPQNLYHPVEVTTLKPLGKVRSFLSQHIRNSGAYVFDRLDLTRQLQFVGGLRWSEYHVSQVGTRRSDISRMTPSASLSYRLVPNTSVYASYVEALESAGSAPITAENAGQILPAAVSKQEEIGIRTQFANHTLASLAVFNLRQPAASTDRHNVFALDGMARYRGVELSVQGDVTENVSMIASAVFLDARRIASSNPGLVGKTPENAARVTASLFAEYRVPLVTGLSVNGGMYYTGPRAVNDANQASVGGATVFTAGLRYSTRVFGKRAKFQANLENASNKRYWSAVGSNQIGVGLARSLELSSTIDF